MTAPVRVSVRPAPFVPLAGASVALVGLVAALGPSAAEPPVGRHGLLPPYAAGLPVPDAVVSLLLAAAVLLGAAALALALRRGVAVPARRLVVAGAVAAGALALLPPVGSADPLSYAAYGHAAVTEHDPYAVPPATLAAHGDPIAAAVQPPWQHTPSVYGPLATAEQAALAGLAGGSLPLTVWLLGLVNAGAFVAAGVALQRLVRTEPQRRRAAVLWSANPLLLLTVVAGGHLDALVAALLAAALLVLARRPAAAGALTAAAAAVKAPAALAGLAFAGLALRTPRRLVALAAGAAVVAVPAYLLAGPHALDQLGRAARMVSFGTPWRLVAHLTDPALGHGASRRLISWLALALGALLAVGLLRRLPAAADAERAPVRAAFALTLAWLLVAPYALPWYDAAGWLLLAALAASRYDALLLAHTTVLALAYLPGRDVPLASPVAGIASAMRTGASPVLLAVVLLAAAALGSRPLRPRAR